MPEQTIMPECSGSVDQRWLTMQVGKKLSFVCLIYLHIAPIKDIEFLRWFPCAIDDSIIAECGYSCRECKAKCGSCGGRVS